MRLWNALLVTAPVCLVCALIILCFTPPVSRDALSHHLAIPKLYINHGGIYEIPQIMFSYYPMNLDMLYMIPLYFGYDIIPKYIHLLFGLLTSLLIFFYLKKRLDSAWGIVGGIFFLSTPIVIKLCTTAYVDLGLVFFSTASLLSFLKWIKTDFQKKYLFLSAVMCGLAMGTKYNGLITFSLLTLFVPFIFSRYNHPRRLGILVSIRYGLLFLFTSLVVFSPWMIRDFIWTGNPIYPLYDKWFNPSGYMSGASFGIFTYRSLVYNENWFQILILPLRVFFQGRDGVPQFFDGKLNPFLLILPIFAFYHLKYDNERIKVEKKILLSFSALYFVFALFSSHLRVRYISPIIPPLVILSVFGLKRLLTFPNESSSSQTKLVGVLLVTGSILSALSLNTAYLIDQFTHVKPFTYISGKVSRIEYIKKHRPEYSAMEFINNNLPSDAKILFIFMGNRGYYCDRSYLFDMVYHKSRFENIVKGARDFHEILQGLKTEGITHLLINVKVFNKWAYQSFKGPEREKVKKFFAKCLRHIYSKNGYSVFEVLK